MKLSDTTTALIRELYETVSTFERLTGRRRSQVDILEDIRKTNQSLALLHICQPLSIIPSAASRKASEVIHELMERLPLERLIWLDQQVRDRSYSYCYKSDPWKIIYPRLVGISSITQGTEVSILGLASMQRDGYVRESAVDQLSKIDDGRELPFLILRLNDWVTAVRTKADRYVRERLKVDYGAHFVKSLGLVHHLKNVGRTNQIDLITAISVLLQSTDCKDALSTGLDSSDRMVKRLSFQLASESKSHNSPEVCKKALAQDDPVVRFWAAKTVVNKLDDKFSPLLLVMQTDPFMPVRREALNGYMNLSNEEALRELKAGLLDHHSSIREFCRFYLKERGFTDFARFYRQTLANAKGGRLIGVIAGLGEVGNTDDIPIVKTALNGQQARLRKVAIVALSKLLKDDAICELLPYLSDASLAISQLVSRLLLRRTHYFSSIDLWQIYKAETRLVAKKHILRLIATFNRWIALPYLLQAYLQDDSNEFHVARDQLKALIIHDWNQSFTTPSKDQFETIMDILNQSCVRKDDPLLKEVQAVLVRYKT